MVSLDFVSRWTSSSSQSSFYGPKLHRAVRPTVECSTTSDWDIESPYATEHHQDKSSFNMGLGSCVKGGEDHLSRDKAIGPMEHTVSTIAIQANP